MCEEKDLEIILQHMARSYYLVFGGDVVKILLYGSYARGDYQKDSDIDLAAIVRGRRLDLQEGLKKIWDVSGDLELEYGIVVSPTVIPFEEFEIYKKDLSYYRNIWMEGVEICV